MPDPTEVLSEFENDLIEFMDDLKRINKKNRQARWIALAAVAISIAALIIRLA